MTHPEGSSTGWAELTFTVTEDDTAAAVGSGDLPVLGTPRLLAWMEAATCAAAGDLGPERTTVGTRADLEHLAATAVGGEVRVRATRTHQDGRLLRFEAVAHDASGQLVGRAEVTRVAVDRDRFLSRLR